MDDRADIDMDSTSHLLDNFAKISLRAALKTIIVITTVGAGTAHALCTDTQHCSVTATASPLPPRGGTTIGTGSGGGGYSSPSVPTRVQQARLEKCAQVYGSYNGHKGPNPAYTIKYSNQYGWYAEKAGGAEVDWRATTTGAPPADAPGCQGRIWLQNDGTTFPTTSSCNGTTWAGKTTIIWASAYSSDARMVNVLAHEFAHQWGADEPNAKYAGDAAQNAYQQDHNGEQCW